MLDYRANKLFVILFGLPMFVLTWFFVFAKPLVAYYLAFHYLDTLITRFVAGLLFLFLIEVLLYPLIYLLDRGLWSLFSLLVDVIPADGRSQEEAKLVVVGGKRALIGLQLLKNPREWTPELIDEAEKTDWVQRLFFAGEVSSRLNYIRRRHRELEREDPNYCFSWQYFTRLFSEDIEARAYAPSPMAEFICKKTNRLMIYPYLIALYFLLANPVGYG